MSLIYDDICVQFYDIELCEAGQGVCHIIKHTDSTLCGQTASPWRIMAMMPELDGYDICVKCRSEMVVQRLLGGAP